MTRRRFARPCSFSNRKTARRYGFQGLLDLRSLTHRFHGLAAPDFVQAQCWVTLGVSVLGHGNAKLVLPILSRLVPDTGNRNKLTIALALLRVLAPTLTVPARLLCDSWFMRARLDLPLLSRGIPVIAQARIDTALFLPPDTVGKPGRGRSASTANA